LCFNSRILGLPIGLALNFQINGKETVVPMVIEEPSVIAAASSAAKTIGNFSATFTNPRNITESQILLTDVDISSSIQIVNMYSLIKID
jgi:hydroxymethylglutaryl-CoA reductase